MTDELGDKQSRILKEALIKIKQLKEREKKFEEPIAIIGLSCRFPAHSNSPELFWKALVEGIDGIADIPSSRFDSELYYDPEPGKPNKIITKKGAFIDDIDLFDPAFFGISPIEADTMDPQQRLLLHVTWEALESAGIAPSSLAGSLTGVFIGVSSNEYGALISKNTSNLSAHFASGNALNALAGRLSYCYGLQGPSLIVDTACSSSLVGLHTACKSLLAGDCTLAIAGGANIILDPSSYIALSAGQMLAPDGHCKTFDASADGYARGEGIGVLILKRLSDAQRDGDSVLAVIKGSAVNQDGPSSGLTVPSGVAQASLIREALSHAKLTPLDITYVEAHGTGTSLGDPIEVNAIAEVYGELRDANTPLLLGSVKSNMGHLESAAGMSSMFKMILALQHQALPGDLHFKTLNPKIDLAAIPAQIVTQLTPWSVHEGQKRIAGISGFGFTGTNAHIILEEAPVFAPKESLRDERPVHLLVLSAKTQQALNQLVVDYQAFLETSTATLADITYTAATGRNHELFRLAVSAGTIDELIVKLSQKDYVSGEVTQAGGIDIDFKYDDEVAGYRHSDVSHGVMQIEIGQDVNWADLLDDLGAHYVAGAAVNWMQWDALFGRKKINLPTYPFEYASYWSKFARPKQGNALMSVETHPFLARRLDTPAFKGIVYESTIDFQWPEFVSHHLIYDAPVIAGAGYISALLSIIKELDNTEGACISDLNWIRPLVFNKGEHTKLQIILQPEEGGSLYRVEVISLNESEPDAEWFTHATGLIKKSGARPLTNESIESIKARLNTHYTGECIYQEVPHRISLDLGVHFRWIEDVHLSADELLAQMRLPAGPDESAQYLLYPGFIDSVFQTGFSYMLVSGQMDMLSIPLYLKEAWYDQSKGYPRWVHAHRKQEEGEDVWNYVLLNELSEVVGEFSGFRTRAVPKEALLRAQGYDTERLIYESVWEEHALPELDLSPATESWLILGDGELSLRIRELLQSKSIPCECIPTANLPQTKEAFAVLLETLNAQKPLAGILHTASADDFELLNSDTLSNAQVIGCESVLHLTQALIAQVDKFKPCLVLITREITSFFSSVNIVHSPLNGLFKTILAEHPELMMKHIDLTLDFNPALLSKTLFVNDEERAFALTKTGCYVPRLFKSATAQRMRDELEGEHQAESNEQPVSEHNIKTQVTYLITGGLGGLGLTLANWLAEQGATHLVLTGRRALDEEIQAVINRMKRPSLSIVYEAMDIGDPQAVEQLVTTLQHSAQPLKGIFHLAGVLDDATLMAQDWTHFETVFRPKVYGSFYLHHYSKNLDFFVMFSSISSSLGSPGQSNYAAANAFMDALCAYRKHKGLAGLSLSWGPWADVGMAKDLVSRHAKSGILGLKPKEGMSALEVALLSRQAHLSIAHINWDNYLKSLLEIPTWLAAFAQKKSSQETLLARLESVPVTERQSQIKHYVTEVVRAIIGLSAGQSIDEKKGFFDMGLDSLMATELKNRLQQGLGKTVRLSSTIVFDYSSVASMTQHLVELLKIDSIKPQKQSLTPMAVRRDDPIAIVGMGCRFPGGANNPEAFWQLLEKGIDGICEVPKERFDVNEYYDPAYDVPGKMYTRNGGFLTVPVDLFDADFFGISPKEAQDMDPQQRLLLEVTWEALEQAGIPQAQMVGSMTGLFVGLMWSDYSELILTSEGTKGMGPYYGSGNSFSSAVGRVSYILGLQGPCLAIDTACSSSLVAINSACESLRLGQCEQAIAGGVNLMLSPGSFIFTSQAHMLSPDGHCKSFDAAADGYARAEGCGIVVLKRLSDAQRDGDTVYALVKSSGVNHGGASSGLTVPNGKAQEALLRQVSSEVGLNADDMDYIEAHGTGTSLGDPIEIRAIGAAYGLRDPSHPLWIGSVKSNIGHTEPAAGVAGVIKLVLALNHEALPGNLHFNVLNPKIDLNFPATILTQTTPWPHSDRVRRAGINSFGFSGTNAHVIIEEAPKSEAKVTEAIERPLHILTLSAKTEDALEALIKNYLIFLNTTKALLADICFTANTGRNHEHYRLAVIAKDVTDLKIKLEKGEFFKGEAQGNNALELPELSAPGDWEKQLNGLARAYSMGAEVDWVDFDASYARQKVTLPTYPFQRKRYWAEGAVLKNKARTTKEEHRLLGDRTSFANNMILFEGSIDLESNSFLKDFQIDLEIVYPTSLFFEMILACGILTSEAQKVSFRTIKIEGTLLRGKGDLIETQTFFKPSNSAPQIIEIFIKPDENHSAPWQLYATGEVSSEGSLLPEMNPYSPLVDGCTKMSPSTFYERFTKSHCIYGTRYKGLQKIEISGDIADGEVDLTVDIKKMYFHPAILTSCFDLIYALLPLEAADNNPVTTFQPIACDEIIVAERLGYYVKAKMKLNRVLDNGDVLAELMLYNEEGAIALLFKGLLFKKFTYYKENCNG